MRATKDKADKGARAAAGFVPLDMAGGPVNAAEAFTELARRLHRVCLLADGQTARLAALVGCDVDRAEVFELLDLIREQASQALGLARDFINAGPEAGATTRQEG